MGEPLIISVILTCQLCVEVSRFVSYILIVHIARVSLANLVKIVTFISAKLCVHPHLLILCISVLIFSE